MRAIPGPCVRAGTPSRSAHARQPISGLSRNATGHRILDYDRFRSTAPTLPGSGLYGLRLLQDFREPRSLTFDWSAEQDSLSQERETGSPVGLAFHELDFTLTPPVRP